VAGGAAERAGGDPREERGHLLAEAREPVVTADRHLAGRAATGELLAARRAPEEAVLARDEAQEFLRRLDGRGQRDRQQLDRRRQRRRQRATKEADRLGRQAVVVISELRQTHQAIPGSA